MDNQMLAHEWFLYAKQDLASANYLMGMQPMPVEIICYHCQQSVEKYLKGFILLNGGSIQKTHDLVMLNKSCKKYNSSFLTIEEECLELTDYGVQVRYPFNLELNENDVQLALKSAKRVQNLLTEMIDGEK